MQRHGQKLSTIQAFQAQDKFQKYFGNMPPNSESACFEPKGFDV